MDTFGILKNYFWKFALPTLVVTLTLELAFTQGNPINQFVGTQLKIIKGDQWIDIRGGLRKGMRGKQYFDSIDVKIYDHDQAPKLKDFMLTHITDFQPAIFLQIAKDWEAISKWNLSTDEGFANLEQAFNGTAIDVISYSSLMYSFFFPSNERVVTDMGDLLNETRSNQI